MDGNEPVYIKILGHFKTVLHICSIQDAHAIFHFVIIWLKCEKMYTSVCLSTGLWHNWRLVSQNSPEDCSHTVFVGEICAIWNLGLFKSKLYPNRLFNVIYFKCSHAETVTAGCVSVGIFTRRRPEIPAVTASSGTRRLQGRLLLPPQSDWNWLRLFSVPVKYVSIYSLLIISMEKCKKTNLLDLGLFQTLVYCMRVSSAGQGCIYVIKIQ